MYEPYLLTYSSMVNFLAKCGEQLVVGFITIEADMKT